MRPVCPGVHCAVSGHHLLEWFRAPEGTSWFAPPNINYGMLFTAWGVTGYFASRAGGMLFDKYHNYKAAFYLAGGLAVVALLCELLAKRPKVPER